MLYFSQKYLITSFAIFVFASSINFLSSSLMTEDTETCVFAD